ncbi:MULTISPECIES: single-stranded DNA-binding protein [Pseudonocardia]|uniref:Single-stranded DNA-binding protein n=2 Tax=Pseudonocardia TaxID=1847 RepID=A0A1Y2MLJ5_PSEAH|nr:MULTISPECIES: single-stranded DNA-binding protein [Pseudonocardia]OSY36144.1 Single-stranded DNA-binding protein [Pseudonocardia autotrophica]TDN76577.1 single-strand DNA-binding protein [Pseudonocardia autotrophica]BBG00578.1 single-stranded DNA-binding protein [Pseudonocardia autotrophica]GEC26962.1 single-stranded DNA-binding protein [Pseudonocardia saturnea]
MTTNRITVVGNLTRKPVLRYTPTGVAVVEMTVAENYRRMDVVTKEWRDVSKTFYRVTCWRNLAEHVAGTLGKGHPVIVVGRMYMDEWIGREGELRRTLCIDAVSVGLDLKYSAALVPPRAPGADRQAAADGRTERPLPEWEPVVDEPSADDNGEIEEPFDVDVDDAEKRGIVDRIRQEQLATAPASEG